MVTMERWATEYFKLAAGVGATLLGQMKKDPLTAVGHGVGLAGAAAGIAPFIFHPKAPEEPKNQGYPGGANGGTSNAGMTLR
jgi:hypothetical protein